MNINATFGVNPNENDCHIQQSKKYKNGYNSVIYILINENYVAASLNVAGDVHFFKERTG